MDKKYNHCTNAQSHIAIKVLSFRTTSTSRYCLYFLYTLYTYVYIYISIFALNLSCINNVYSGAWSIFKTLPLYFIMRAERQFNTFFWPTSYYINLSLSSTCLRFIPDRKAGQTEQCAGDRWIHHQLTLTLDWPQRFPKTLGGRKKKLLRSLSEKMDITTPTHTHTRLGE